MFVGEIVVEDRLAVYFDRFMECVVLCNDLHLEGRRRGEKRGRCIYVPLEKN